MTINYSKTLRELFYVAVCLFGIEQAAFSSDEEFDGAEAFSENELKKKGGYLSRVIGEAKKMANTAKDAALESTAGKEATRMVDDAKKRVASSKTGKVAQKTMDDMKNKICTIKLKQAKSNTEKLQTQAGQLHSNSHQLAAIAKQQSDQAAEIKAQCGSGVFCTVALKLYTYGGNKYLGLAQKMNKMAKDMTEDAEEAAHEIEALEEKCGSN